MGGSVRTIHGTMHVRFFHTMALDGALAQSGLGGNDNPQTHTTRLLNKGVKRGGQGLKSLHQIYFLEIWVPRETQVRRLASSCLINS